MSVIRLNLSAPSDPVQLHGSQQCTARALRRAAAGTGPIILMIHGYKYDPFSPRHCPQALIFGPGAAHGWPAALGLLRDDHALGVTIGWRARGRFAGAYRTAGLLGADLARVITTLHKAAPKRPVHLMAHSLGAELALSALAQAPAKSVGRVVLLTGASYLSHARAALDSPAGRHAELLNVVSRENDIFDFAFERLIRPDGANDRALGQGLWAGNALTLQLDCAETLQRLTAMGCALGAPIRRVCHWSSYTRPGAMDLYARFLRRPASLPLTELHRALPQQTDARWSRLGLGKAVKTRMMPKIEMRDTLYERAN